MSKDRIDLKEFEDLQHSWRTRSGIYDELFSDWIEGRKEEIMAELKRCYRIIDNLTSIECTTCNKSYNKSDYGIKYHRITVPDDSLLYEYREDMQEHCIECIAPDEAIGKNCICDLCMQWHAGQNASE